MVTTTADVNKPKTKTNPKPRAKKPVSAAGHADSKPVSKAAPRTRTSVKAKPSKEVKASATHSADAAPTLKEAAAKSRRKVSTVVHMTRDASFKLIDSQRAIWLAGLGALARVTASTGSKGEKAFEALVKAGEQMEQQARQAIDSNADLLKHRIDDASKAVDERIETVSDAFDTRVKQVLSRAGYPKAVKTAPKKRGSKKSAKPA